MFGQIQQNKIQNNLKSENMYLWKASRDIEKPLRKIVWTMICESVWNQKTKQWEDRDLAADAEHESVWWER